MRFSLISCCDLSRSQIVMGESKHAIKLMYTYEYLFCTEKSQIEPLSLEPQSQV